MKEIIILSGKGGTGKTTVTAGFASLAKSAIFADCDVDAADLHLVLNPNISEKHDFISGHEAIIRTDDCIGCMECVRNCRFDAIEISPKTNKPSIIPTDCEGCGVCVEFCPAKAIDFPDRFCGEWYLSETRFGKLVHAKLGIAAENSGKLVSMVRKEAKRLAEESGSDMILVDGPPGIGCPVIASVSGADAILVVTEPTLSGIHDAQRVISLAKHFGIKILVCVNKWNINPELSQKIEQMTNDLNATFLGKLPYDSAVSQAQILGKTVIECEIEPISSILKDFFSKISNL